MVNRRPPRHRRAPGGRSHAVLGLGASRSSPPARPKPGTGTTNPLGQEIARREQRGSPRLTAGREPLQGKLADRLQHPKARRGLGRRGRHRPNEALVHQCGDEGRAWLGDALDRPDTPHLATPTIRRFQRESPGEHAQPSKQPLLFGLEQLRNSRRWCRAWFAGDPADPAAPGQQRQAGHSRSASASGESTLTQRTASSIASGSPSSCRHSLATAGVFAAVRAKSPRTSTARSTKRRTAATPDNPVASSPAAPSRSGTASGWTTNSRSPRRWRRSRLVTSMTSSGQAASNSAMSGAAPSRCSKLSRTSAILREPIAAANDAAIACGAGSLVPRARAIAPATSGVAFSAGPMMWANSTQATPSGKAAAIASAAAMARRVLPTPPGPVSVMRRACPNSHREGDFATSRSRPMRRVGGRGGDCNRPHSPLVARGSARGAVAALRRGRRRLGGGEQPSRSSSASDRASARARTVYGRGVARRPVSRAPMPSGLRPARSASSA